MNIKKRIFKTTSIVLVATLVGISSYALVNDKIVKTPAPVQQKRETPLPKKNSSKETSTQEKEETVYVFTASDGSVQNIIVSDWLKNKGVSDLTKYSVRKKMPRGIF